MTCGVGRFAQVQALEEQQSQDGYQIEEMIAGVAMTVEVYVPDQSPVGFTPSLLALRVCAHSAELDSNWCWNLVMQM